MEAVELSKIINIRKYNMKMIVETLNNGTNMKIARRILVIGRK